MLRFLFLVLLVYYLLRWLRGLLPKPRLRPRQGPQNPPGPMGRPPSSQPKVIDEMKPCPACGTFNPTRLAYEKKGLYFCDQRCHEAFIRGEIKT